MDYNGIVNVYKEAGFTSHDVVAKLRGILHQKKIGHTGTLDPDAVVLPVCLGKATKVCELITDWSKTYEAELLLGTVTDTLDISGNILEINDVNVEEKQIVEVIGNYIGDIMQVPPMYSALKHNGKKLYELARDGIEIERQARKIHIDAIRINEICLDGNEKTIRFSVDCSKGTYIRSLCDDIGRDLGCGACMKSLKRTRVGNFKLDETYTLNQIAALVLKGEFEETITRVDDIFNETKILIPHTYDKYLENGNKFIIANDLGLDLFDGEKYRVYNEDGLFVGIYIFEDNMLVPVKMFLV